MAYLSWISDTELTTEVKLLLTKAKEAKKKAENEFGKNVIDPFAILFEMSGFDLDYDDWYKNETARQAQKTLQNHVGTFHQNILGYAKDWDNLNVGSVVDLSSTKNTSIAEVKNKYNTISGGKLSDLYYSLDGQISPKSSIYKDYTAYYVTIIPSKPTRFNRPFTPSDKDKGRKCESNKLIREIDGASFYALVTGVKNALEQLYDVLPTVIEECSVEDYIFENSEELKTYFTAAFGDDSQTTLDL